VNMYSIFFYVKRWKKIMVDYEHMGWYELYVRKCNSKVVSRSAERVYSMD
jgi:hypothetical protein